MVMLKLNHREDHLVNSNEREFVDSIGDDESCQNPQKTGGRSEDDAPFVLLNRSSTSRGRSSLLCYSFELVHLRFEAGQ